MSETKQSIEELTKRYQSLNERKITADANLKNAKTQLEQLQREAREKYGTDDVAQLRQLLEKQTAENEEKRRTYQADLDRIEGEVNAVEQKFATESLPAGGKENAG